MVTLVTLKRGKGLGGFFKSGPLFTRGTVGMLTMNGTLLSLPSDRAEVKIINFRGFVCSKREAFCLMKNS